jgi:hypothetical protein
VVKGRNQRIAGGVLTNREEMIARLGSEGASNAQIASELEGASVIGGLSLVYLCRPAVTSLGRARPSEQIALTRM